MDLFQVFIGIALLIVVASFIFASKSFHKRTELGKWLGMVFVMILSVTVSYVFSIMIKDYFWSSVFSSIYFMSSDVMLVSLLRFVHVFTGLLSKKSLKIMSYLTFGYMLFDIGVFLINPFIEISVHYELVQWLSYTKYVYVMKPLYYMHLVFSYILIVSVLIQLIISAFTAPTGYRRQYGLAVGGILSIVAVNAIFLYLPNVEGISFLDYSIWGYCIVGFFLYWICFEYTSHGMLNVIRNWILETLDQGIVLFDYRDQLILFNKKAETQLTKRSLKSNQQFRDFILECGLKYDSLHAKNEFSYQFYVDNKGKEYPLRYDYRPMLNAKGELIGKLLVFTDVALEQDLLTGFRSWDSFLKSVDAVGIRFTLHRSVAVCDINNLSEVNSSYGRNEGDQAISRLAVRMRQNFPDTTMFVRGNDASLIALCVSENEKTISRRMAKVLKEFNEQDYEEMDIKAQGAVYVMTGTDHSLHDGVKKALRGMRSRKMMDEKSQHSALLNSLMRALEECDPDTSNHVQRTQALGEKLGRRIGLKDVEQTSLSLLCMLHDIGKIGIPLEILNKPGKLTESERDVMQTHVDKGYQIVNSSKELNLIADMILHHHERWDGNGYPDGLSKESIPLLSRVIAVVDAYDAMIHDRAYRKAMSKKAAIEELYRNAGTQFDPRLSAQLIGLIREEMSSENELEEELPSKEAENDAGSGAKSIPQMIAKTSKNAGNYHAHVHEVNFSRYILNDKEEIVEADENFTNMTGYSREDYEKQKLTQFDLIFPEDRAGYFKLIQAQLNKNGTAYIEHRICKKDGSALYVYCYGKPYYSSGNREKRVEIIITDVTRTYAVQTMLNNEQKKAKERLKYWEEKYRCDSLTGLMTHEAFRNDVEVQLLERSNKILYLIMDVDFFKQYNDTYGHHEGDEFLICVGQMIMSQTRSEYLACRLGGDEFIAALFFDQETPNAVLMERARKLYAKINMSLTQMKGNVSLSMGGVISDQIEKCDYTKLYEAADRALYESKKQGRARLTFSEEMV